MRFYLVFVLVFLAFEAFGLEHQDFKVLKALYEDGSHSSVVAYKEHSLLPAYLVRDKVTKVGDVPIKDEQIFRMSSRGGFSIFGEKPLDHINEWPKVKSVDANLAVSVHVFGGEAYAGFIVDSYEAPFLGKLYSIRFTDVDISKGDVFMKIEGGLVLIPEAKSPLGVISHFDGHTAVVIPVFEKGNLPDFFYSSLIGSPSHCGIVTGQHGISVHNELVALLKLSLNDKFMSELEYDLDYLKNLVRLKEGVQLSEKYTYFSIRYVIESAINDGKIADLDVLEPLVWQYEMDNPRKSEKFSDYNYWLSQFHLMRGWHDRAFKTGQASMRIAPDIQWYKKFYDQLRAAVAKVNEDHSTGKTE